MQAEHHELLLLAREATPGPWAFGSFHKLLVVPVIDGEVHKHDPIADLGDTEIPYNKTDDSTQRYADAAYIAAASPDVVAPMIEYIERIDRAVMVVLEGYTLPLDVRKILETAYYS